MSFTHSWCRGPGSMGPGSSYPGEQHLEWHWPGVGCLFLTTPQKWVWRRPAVGNPASPQTLPPRVQGLCRAASCSPASPFPWDTGKVLVVWSRSFCCSSITVVPPCSHSQSPPRCPCPWVLYTCPFTGPFPFPLLSPAPSSWSLSVWSLLPCLWFCFAPLFCFVD